MGKLDTRAVSARPRGPSALPSNHEIVSDGCELSPHAYKVLGPRTRSPTPSKKSAPSLPAFEATNSLPLPASATMNPFHRRRFHKSPYIDKLRMSYGPAWPNLKQAVKGMKEIIDLARAGRLPPLDEPPPTA